MLKLFQTRKKAGPVAKILIVDDNFDNLELLTMIFEAAGHEVKTAADGLKGLEAVTQRIPDVVLLDVEMPVLSGPEMAFELFLRNCGDEKIPLVLLSGIVGLDEVAAVVGTPYSLTKPYSPEALLQTVDRALQEKTAPQPRRKAS
jgi:CheY-like chemotaxis protein